MKKVWIMIMSFIFVVPTTMAWAENEYPNKPIEVVIPYAAGGSADFIIRIVAEKMTKDLGQPLVIVSKPGGAGAVGTNFVARSRADGYTLLMTSCGVVTRPLFDPSAPYRINEFTPIATFETHGHLMAVNSSFPVKNIKELVDYAKKNPGTVSAGGSGIGGVNYLALELLKLETQMTDKNIQWVPHRGDVEPLVALIGNHIQVSVTTPAPCKTYVNTKEIRPLVMLAKKRDPSFPDVPTAIEQGFPDIEAMCFLALFAPAKTPQPIIEKLESAMEKALADREVQDGMKKIDFEVPAPFMGSKATQAMVDQSNKKWAELIKRANLGVKR